MQSCEEEDAYRKGQNRTQSSGFWHKLSWGQTRHVRSNSKILEVRVLSMNMEALTRKRIRWLRGSKKRVALGCRPAEIPGIHLVESRTIKATK